MRWLVACAAAGTTQGQDRWSVLNEHHHSAHAGHPPRGRELREQELDRLDRLAPVEAVLEDDRRLPRLDPHHPYKQAEDFIAPEERKVAEVHADGSLSMLMETASSAWASLSQLPGPLDADAELPLGDGAPSDGYHNCAVRGDMCKCEKGEVRYGSTSGSHLFTHPVMLGADTEVQCDQAKLAAVMLAAPEGDGAEENAACECNDRFVHVQVDLGTVDAGRASVGSLLEGDGETTTDSGHLCLVPGAASGSFEQREGLLDQLTGNDEGGPVAMQSCPTAADSAKDWVFLLSTGQIKHVDSGTCLTAEFPSDAEGSVAVQRQVTLRSCSLVDSQVLTQRWEVPFYIAPDFEVGSGTIRLSYGAHSKSHLCLSNDGMHLILDRCDVDSGTTEWKMSSVGGAKHTWKVCAEPGQSCSCAGDVKYGSSDSKHYSQAIGVQGAGSGSVTCSLEALQDVALWEPESSEGKQCQCRHDAFMDGEGDKLEAMKLDEAERAANKGGMLMPVVGGGLFLCLAAGGWWAYKRKQASASDDYGEYEEEEYEEEYEEE